MLDPNKVKLAIAPIGWTNDDMPDLGAENTFEQCVSEMALAGFKGSEIGNKYPSDPDVLKKYLDIRGLQICNAWFSSYLTSKPYEETIEAFKAHCDKLHKLGAKVIGASEQGNSIQGDLTKSILDEKPYYTDEQWEIVTKGFNEMGAYAKSKGMYFTVHHHMGTGVQTVEEIDKLMDMTDPDLVYLLFDSGHLTFAGIDPVPVLKKYVNRVKHVHLKDVRLDVYNNEVVPKHMSFLDAVRAGVFTVPGDGDVDFKPIFDIQKMNAMLPTEKTYLKTSVFETWKSRFPWLLLLMVSATFTGSIITGFENKLATLTILTSFIPMLMDTGGNSGGQSSVTVIRALSLGEIQFKDYFKVVWKEIRVGIFCGLSLAAVNFVKIWLIDHLAFHNDDITILVDLAVCITLFIEIIFAKVIGCTLPILAKKCGFDPAVMSSPFITTIVDAVSLLVFFGVATTIIPQLH